MQHSIRTLFNTILIGDEGEYNDEKFRFFPLSFCWEIERLWEMCRGKIGQYLKKKGRCSIKNKTKNNTQPNAGMYTLYWLWLSL